METKDKAIILFHKKNAPTTIGAIEVDILIEEEYTLKSTVTEHPVEDGFAISDHTIREAIELNLVVGIAALPVTWLDRLGTGEDKLIMATTEFERIYKEADVITIVTKNRIFENMVMTSAVFKNSNDEKGLLRIPCSFKQIRKVKVKKTSIPQDIVDLDMINRAGETESAGGEASVNEINSSSGGSDGDIAKEAQDAKGRSTMHEIFY